MATPALGRIEKFDRHHEDWPQYVERLEFYFTANGIMTEEKKRAVFLSVIGALTYRVLRNLLTADKPGDKTFTDLTAMLEQHYSPTPSEIVERFKFDSR